jgi:hypothetical protein
MKPSDSGLRLAIARARLQLVLRHVSWWVGRKVAAIVQWSVMVLFLAFVFIAFDLGNEGLLHLQTIIHYYFPAIQFSTYRGG